MSEAALLDEPPVTIGDFNAFLGGQADPRPWELVAGRIVGMTNPNTVHEQIVSNIGLRLKQAADKRGCQAFFGGMRIQRSENQGAIDKPRPDLMVRCGALVRQNFVTDPLVIVEVLSPSTMDVDRGDKLRFYKRLPTLAHIAFAYQDQMRVEHYRKMNTGWEMETLTASHQAVVFEAISCSINMEDAYFGAGLDDFRG
jgi:Uma2 family endonuclease